jgi:hypothetical protein
MTLLKGILLKVDTDHRSWAGTDDRMYIGVVGTAGGREFAVDVRRFDDFEPNTDVLYIFGTVWDGNAASGAKKPVGYLNSYNDPDLIDIGLEEVTQVYIRKTGTRRSDRDDAYLMDSVSVGLYGGSSERRSFVCMQEIRMSNESGLQVWLHEARSQASS